MRVQTSDVYVSFLPKYQLALDRPMADILQGIGREQHPGKLYETLYVTGEDEQGNDVLPPFIQYSL